MNTILKSLTVGLATWALGLGCGASEHGENVDAPAETSTEAPPSPPRAPELRDLEMPESAIHDPIADVYLVSNIVGSPAERDGVGYISRVSPEGELLERHWIDGLDAPKGMAISGEILAVADLVGLRWFNRSTGEPIDVAELPEARFPNDVAAGPDGSFFVSDSGFQLTADGFGSTGTDAIYRIASDGAVTKIAEGIELLHPNGLWVHEDELWMVPVGGNMIFRFGLNGEARGQVQLPGSQLDGIVETDGCIAIFSHEGPALLIGTLEGSFEERNRGLAGGDIGYDASRHRILTPTLSGNSLRFDAFTGCPASETHE